MEFYVVLVTVPDDETAETVSDAVVGEGLAKCVNIVDGVKSVFFWEGKVQDEKELLMIIKTRKDNFPSLMSRVKELHPYTVPEIIALPIVEGYGQYLSWLNS